MNITKFCCKLLQSKCWINQNAKGISGKQQQPFPKHIVLVLLVREGMLLSLLCEGFPQELWNPCLFPLRATTTK